MALKGLMKHFQHRAIHTELHMPQNEEAVVGRHGGPKSWRLVMKRKEKCSKARLKELSLGRPNDLTSENENKVMVNMKCSLLLL